MVSCGLPVNGLLTIIHFVDCDPCTQLISQGAASSGLNELIVAIGRSQDPYQLSEKVVPHLEAILKVRVNPDKSRTYCFHQEKNCNFVCVCVIIAGSEVVEWDVFATVMEALLATLQGFSTFMQVTNIHPSTFQLCLYLLSVRSRVGALKQACVPTLVSLKVVPREKTVHMLIPKKREIVFVTW